jgi:hypothetical protein
MPESDVRGGAWKALLSARSLMVNLAVIAAFGIFVPWSRGLDFFDSIVIFSYSAIALLFAASTITDLVRRQSDSVVSLIGTATLYAWLTLLIIYALGIATVNLTYRAPQLLHPNWKLFGGVLLFSLTGSLFLAAFGALLSILFSPAWARTVVRALFAVVLVGIYFQRQVIPPDWQDAFDRFLTTAGLTRIAFWGAGMFAVLAAGLILALRSARRPVLLDGRG